MGFGAGYGIGSRSLPILLTIIISNSLYLSSAILNYTLLIATNLKWACNFLLHHSLFHHRQHAMPESAENLRARRYEKPVRSALESDDEEVDCAVCLCGIEEGDEVKEMRCDHLFHSDCFDRWAGYNRHATCPLCRDDPTAPRRLFTELGEEVVVFKFASFTSGDRDLWWLR